MRKEARKIDYLLRRPGSQNWNIRLQYPGGKVREFSLGTASKQAAVIKSLPIIADHKAALLAARPRAVESWVHKLAPGREHTADDGGRIIATDRELIYMNRDNTVARQEPNGGPAYLVQAALPRLGIFEPAVLPMVANRDARPPLAIKSSDDAILETYLKHANVSGHFEREARAVWALFKEKTNNKPLRDCDRNDGRLLVEHFDALGLKSATIQKKLMWMNAAVNLAIKEGKLKFNPFSGITPKRDDSVTRLPLTEADMRACRDELAKLSDKDQLLFRLLASTGMRLSEAFEVADEATEHGVRYVVVGQKTEQSMRRVPLPETLLPYLPAKITRPLFDAKAPAASKRLNRFLNDCGITDTRKTLHSLRHRAKDRLRAAGCPLDVQYELLGHEEKTIASGYGRGSPVPLLARWQSEIGL